MGLEIVLENQNYATGSEIKGYVRLTISVLQQLNGIKINFSGSALTHWTTTNTKSDANGRTRSTTVYHKGEEDYCKMQYYLFGAAENPGGGRTELHPGTYLYPFSFQVPPGSPPSFEGEWGSVRYIITVTMDIPWAMDVVQEAQVNVTSPFDLNSERECSNPFVLTKGKHFCCCCCASDPLNIEVSIPVCGYVPGQSIAIPLTINCENKSDVEINGIELRLVRNVVFYTQSPSTSERSKKDLIYTLNVGPFIPERKSVAWKKVLDIPSNIVPHLRNCGIIKIDYKIEMEAEPSGCHLSLDGEIPIIMGTIGLASYQPPSSESEIHDISLTMNSVNNIPSSSIGWNIGGFNQNIGPPPIDYHSLPEAKYPPPYPLDIPIVTQPTAPLLEPREI